MLPLATNYHTHYHLHLFHFCVIQVQKFVAKRHPINTNTKWDVHVVYVYVNSNGIYSATARPVHSHIVHNYARRGMGTEAQVFISGNRCSKTADISHKHLSWKLLKALQCHLRQWCLPNPCKWPSTTENHLRGMSNRYSPHKGVIEFCSVCRRPHKSFWQLPAVQN